MRQTGTVRWYDDSKGFGFIGVDSPGRGDVFVHMTGITGEGERSLNDGDRVEFEVVPDAGKGPRAENVVLIADAPPAEPKESWAR